MEDEVEVIYTNEGLERLKRAKDDFTDFIESTIKDYKFAPGDKVLEITASDIEYATKQIESFRRINRRSRLIKIASSAYIGVGLIVLLYGVFREFAIYLNLYILMGIALIIAGYFVKNFLVETHLIKDVDSERTLRKLK